MNLVESIKNIILSENKKYNIIDQWGNVITTLDSDEELEKYNDENEDKEYSVEEIPDMNKVEKTPAKEKKSDMNKQTYAEFTRFGVASVKAKMAEIDRLRKEYGDNGDVRQLEKELILFKKQYWSPKNIKRKVKSSEWHKIKRLNESNYNDGIDVDNIIEFIKKKVKKGQYKKTFFDSMKYLGDKEVRKYGEIGYIITVEQKNIIINYCITLSAIHWEQFEKKPQSIVKFGGVLRIIDEENNTFNITYGVPREELGDFGITDMDLKKCIMYAENDILYNILMYENANNIIYYDYQNNEMNTNMAAKILEEISDMKLTWKKDKNYVSVETSASINGSLKLTCLKEITDVSVHYVIIGSGKDHQLLWTIANLTSTDLLKLGITKDMIDYMDQMSVDDTSKYDDSIILEKFEGDYFNDISKKIINEEDKIKFNFNKKLLEASFNPNVKSSWITQIWFEPNEDELIEDDDGEIIERNPKDPNILGTVFMRVKNSRTGKVYPTYEFPDVPRKVYILWRRARSKGKYFWRRMKYQYGV